MGLWERVPDLWAGSTLTFFKLLGRIELVTYGPRCNRAVKGLGRLFSFLFFEELYRLSLNMIIKAQLILVN